MFFTEIQIAKGGMSVVLHFLSAKTMLITAVIAVTPCIGSSSCWSPICSAQAGRGGPLSPRHQPVVRRRELGTLTGVNKRIHLWNSNKLSPLDVGIGGV